MVISCAALGCKNKQNDLNSHGNKLSFHRFPRDKGLCWAWLVASQRLDFSPTRFSYFCSEHFTEEQFNRTQKGCRLRPNAVPTRFHFNSKAKRWKTPTPPPSPKPSEILPTVKIEPNQHFEVNKIPKKVFPVQPRFRILPKQALDAQTPITIAPKPLVTGVTLAPNPMPAPPPSPKPIEIQTTVKIEPNQRFEVNKTPKKVFPVQPRVRILPKQALDAQTPITIAPKPLVNGVTLAPNPVIDLSSIANTVVNSNLIQAAVSAYKQSTNASMSQQQQPTPVSIYVVHPQPNGSNIVTIPSVQDTGSVPTQNGGSLPTTSFQPATSSKPQSVDNYGERLKNIHKIRSYEKRITKYRKDIKILQLKHQKQQSKIQKLKDIIKDLKRANWVGDDESEEEEISEDMSEDEIYAEYLKLQTVESKKEDFSMDGDSEASV